MSFKLEVSSLVKENSSEIIPGSLKLVDSFVRTSYATNETETKRTHRVYEGEDEKGIKRKYVEIFVRPKLQIFISKLFSNLEVTPVLRYKDEQGKLICLSMFPSEQDFSYSLNGKVKGWAKNLILEALVGDGDHYVEGRMSDSDFKKPRPEAHNINIFLANMLPFDFGEAYDFTNVETGLPIKIHIFDSLKKLEDNIRRMFATGQITEFPNEKQFYLNVIIMAGGLLAEFKTQFTSLGVEGIKKLLKDSGVKSLSAIFPLVPKEYSVEDFYHDMQVKITLLEKQILIESAQSQD